MNNEVLEKNITDILCQELEGGTYGINVPRFEKIQRATSAIIAYVAPVQAPHKTPEKKKMTPAEAIWMAILCFQSMRDGDGECVDRETWSDVVLSYNDVECELYDILERIDPSAKKIAQNVDNKTEGEGKDCPVRERYETAYVQCPDDEENDYTMTIRKGGSIRIKEIEGPVWITSASSPVMPDKGSEIPRLHVYDFSEASEEDKQTFLDGLLKIVGGELLRAYVMLGLKWGIETGVKNEPSGEYYRLSFLKIDPATAQPALSSQLSSANARIAELEARCKELQEWHDSHLT